jgi:hypothetical protein
LMALPGELPQPRELIRLVQEVHSDLAVHSECDEPRRCAVPHLDLVSFLAVHIQRVKHPVHFCFEQGEYGM